MSKCKEPFVISYLSSESDVAPTISLDQLTSPKSISSFDRYLSDLPDTWEREAGTKFSKIRGTNWKMIPNLPQSRGEVLYQYSNLSETITRPLRAELTDLKVKMISKSYIHIKRVTYNINIRATVHISS